MKKRLTLFSLLLLFTMTAMAQTTVDVGGIYYYLIEYNKTAEVTKPDGITYSGDIVIPASISWDGVDYSVTSIGYGVFYNCDGLTSIEIPTSVTKIGAQAFLNCSGLTSIEIPNSVTYIGEASFSGCSGLTSIVVEEGNSYYDSRENCNTIIETASNKLIAGCQNTIIPTSVTSIGSWAFYGCSGLTSIEIPNSVTLIGDGAFSGCSGLTSIEISNSVTTIGYNVFYDCSGLTSIEIPNSVTEIGRRAFYGCSSLTSIVVEEGNSYYDSRENCNAIIEASSNTLVAGCQNTVIPTSVTSIGDNAFMGCRSLTSIEIPTSVTSIGVHAFSGCSGLTSIEIPTSVTSIGDYAFYGCSGLTSIEIPTSVTSIGERAFYKCSGLTSIEIPNSVTSIGERAFAYCSGLTSITMQRATPPTVGDDLFSGCYNLETIYVPVGASEAYNVWPWNWYNIVEREVTGIEEVTLEEWPADVYDLNGRMVKAQAENLDELPKGVYIVNGKKFVK